MPRNNNDFVSGLKRMGQALGYYGYGPTGDSFSNNVKPGPAAKAANPVPFTNNVRVIEKGPTNPPTVGVRRMPPAKGGGGWRGGSFRGSGIGPFGNINK